MTVPLLGARAGRDFEAPIALEGEDALGMMSDVVSVTVVRQDNVPMVPTRSFLHFGRLWMIAGAVLLTAHQGLATQWGTPTLALTIEPTRASFSLHEPVVVAASILNGAEAEKRFDLGEDCRSVEGQMSVSRQSIRVKSGYEGREPGLAMERRK